MARERECKWYLHATAKREGEAEEEEEQISAGVKVVVEVR
jgi:hypothetical protein